MVKVTWLPLMCILENALAFISSVPRIILVKGLGHLLLLSYPVYFACILHFCCLNQKSLNIYLSVFATLSLSRVTCQYLLLLIGIDILIYQKATIDPLDLWDIKNHLLARLTGKETQLNLLTSPPLAPDNRNRGGGNVQDMLLFNDIIHEQSLVVIPFKGR